MARKYEVWSFIYMFRNSFFSYHASNCISLIYVQTYRQYYLNRHVRKRTSDMCGPTKTQTSLHIWAVWPESSMSARRNVASLVIQNTPSEDSDQTARMRRLIWIFSGCKCKKVRFLTFGFIFARPLPPLSLPPAPIPLPPTKHLKFHVALRCVNL